jgi:cysteine desulfurase / selenocysteine lyase
MTILHDINTIRQDFPALHQEVNGHPLVYLDNAATSQRPQSVINALSNFYLYDNANVHRGVHALSERATLAFEQARENIRKFINARSIKEIIFTKGTTESINLVAQSYGRSRFIAGDEILISEMEHHANIVPWQMLCEQTGAVLRVIPLLDSGELDLSQIETYFTDKVKLLAITHISNALGTINPIKSLIELAHAHQVPVLIDGAQAMLHANVDVQALDCDFYCFSGHKMLGPTGVGVLYGKEHWLDKMPPYQGGGEMIKMVSFAKTIYNDLPAKFEAGTPNISGVIGLSAAVDYLRQLGSATIHQHEQALLDYATAQALAFPGLTIIGQAKQKIAILSFILNDIHAHDIGTIVNNYGVAIRTGHHCAMPVMQHYHIAATARASFAFYNTFEEVDQLFYALNKTREVFR